MTWGNYWPETFSEAIPFLQVSSMLMTDETVYWHPETGHIHFECVECGQKFDPDETHFGKLLEKAKAKGWSLKFKDVGYDTWCEKCQ